MSSVTLKSAIEGAKYVEYVDEYTFAVWHGGHTVNFYQESVDSGMELEVFPTHSISVGDFETNVVELEEVKEGIRNFK